MSKVLERDLYEDDFFAWTRRQSKELRRFARTLDLEHLAEEIADLGKEQRNALRCWTIRIIEHLLLPEHSPAARNWFLTPFSPPDTFFPPAARNWFLTPFSP
jgi:hypothetical protein